MSVFELIIVVMTCISALVYTGLMVLLYSGWRKVKPFTVKTKENNTYVSVIIAARNEEAYIEYCINALIKQDYPQTLFEVIVVDDNSEDGGMKVVNSLISKNEAFNLRVLNMSHYGKQGKKEAVIRGVKEAKGTLILTTDADCVAGPQWISTFVAYYEEMKPKMICGPLKFRKSTRLFDKFQGLDFLGLIAAGAGAIGAQKPFMGNAANMAFEKDVFLSLLPSRHDLESASGDDVFLIQGIKEDFKEGIQFIRSYNAIVYTAPKRNLDDLIRQRIRWGSKAKYYKDMFSVFIAAAILDYNFIIVLLTFLSLSNTFFLIPLGMAYLIKYLVDFPLLYSHARFIKATALMKHYFWVQLLYPFYITYTGIASLFTKKYYWKGREVV